MPGIVKETNLFTTLYSLFVLIRKYTTLLFHMCCMSQDLLVAESGWGYQYQKKKALLQELISASRGYTTLE